MKQGWEIKKLGDIGTFQRGGGFLKSDFVEDGYPCVHYGQIHTKFGVKTYNHLTCISEELALSKSKIANSGDIIIAITSEDVEGSCKCTAWLGDYDVAVGGHAAIFKHGLNPAFVAYYFRGPYFNTAKKVYAHGSKVVEIRPADIATINISYPSLSEQEKIVAELDCLSGIIEKKKQQLKELDNLAQSIFYEMFGDPVENGKGWERLLFEKCIEKVRYTAKIATCNYATTGTFPIISQEEDYISGYWNNAEDVFMISKPVVIFGDHTRVLKYVDFDFVLGADGVKILQPIDTINAKFFLYYLIASKIPSLGYSRHYKLLKELKVLLPPLSLQQDFASKIESIEKQKELIAQSIKETETLFNSRMDYYFN